MSQGASFEVSKDLCLVCGVRRELSATAPGGCCLLSPLCHGLEASGTTSAELTLPSVSCLGTCFITTAIEK